MFACFYISHSSVCPHLSITGASWRTSCCGCWYIGCLLYFPLHGTEKRCLCSCERDTFVCGAHPGHGIASVSLQPQSLWAYFFAPICYWVGFLLLHSSPPSLRGSLGRLWPSERDPCRRRGRLLSSSCSGESFSGFLLAPLVGLPVIP